MAILAKPLARGAGAISFAPFLPSPHRRAASSCRVVVPPVTIIMPPIAVLPIAVVVPPVAVVVLCCCVTSRLCRAKSSCRPLPSSCRSSPCCPLPSLCRPLPSSCRVVVLPVTFFVLLPIALLTLVVVVSPATRRCVARCRCHAAHCRRRAACRPAARCFRHVTHRRRRAALRRHCATRCCAALCRCPAACCLRRAPTLCRPLPSSCCIVVPPDAVVVPPIAQQRAPSPIASVAFTARRRGAMVCQFVCDRWRSVGQSTYFTYSHVGCLAR